MNTVGVDGSTRPSRRIVAFIGLCFLCAGTFVFVLHQATGFTASDSRKQPPASEAVTASLLHQPRILFRNTAGASSGSVGVVALGAPGGPEFTTSLGCIRISFAADRGICLTPAGAFIPATKVDIFDGALRSLFSLAFDGRPTRARVSPNGRIGVMTLFVVGDSYAAANFSTRTRFIDLYTGQTIGDLEKFTVFRGGQRFQSLDFNFWGVTFAKDNTTFFATLGTGGSTYLVQGDLSTRQVHVLRSNVECPSLSPDGRRIAFKKRVDTGVVGPVAWRLSVLDLATLQDWPVAETRSVDDQAEWLDNDHLLYGIQEADSSTNVWTVQADGSGRPQLLMAKAWSPAVVRL